MSRKVVAHPLGRYQSVPARHIIAYLETVEKFDDEPAPFKNPALSAANQLSTGGGAVEVGILDREFLLVSSLSTSIYLHRLSWLVLIQNNKSFSIHCHSSERWWKDLAQVR
jgi:hypothetical protein